MRRDSSLIGITEEQSYEVCFEWEKCSLNILSLIFLVQFCFLKISEADREGLNQQSLDTYIYYEVMTGILDQQIES